MKDSIGSTVEHLGRKYKVIDVKQANQTDYAIL